MSRENATEAACIERAREDYNIDAWGAGYFGIDNQGYVVCYPTSNKAHAIRLQEIVSLAAKQGINTPIILRFPQLITSQLRKIDQAFQAAIKEFSYAGCHYGVFPFKVNQQCGFIEAVIKGGAAYNYGLEVGSKTELIAAMSFALPPQALLVCNGFKDDEFVEMACLATEAGKQVIAVVEGLDELSLLLARLKNKARIPMIGCRVRLNGRGSGMWEKTSGSNAKFGLTITELLALLHTIKDAGCIDKLVMLHFHVGSQITMIKKVKGILNEAARIYAKVMKMGFSIKYLDIGGGMGVDYDGSKIPSPYSVNYLPQEFINDSVYVIAQICKEENVPPPHIVSESGRIIAAYNSLLVTDIREVQTMTSSKSIVFPSDQDNLHRCLQELHYIHNNISVQNYEEYYHDAIEHYEALIGLFNLGYLALQERGTGEELFYTICAQALAFSKEQKQQPEEFKNLQQRLASKYLANFSMFQTVPDAWALGQIFPVMPLSQHQFHPNHQGNIVDITCDSDGCLTQYINKKKIASGLALHGQGTEPYYLGFFLVGAYQESLASNHNMFGATHKIEIILDNDGNLQSIVPTLGDSISELLEHKNYSKAKLIANFSKQMHTQESRITKENVQQGIDKFKNYLHAYPYLKI